MGLSWEKVRTRSYSHHEGVLWLAKYRLTPATRFLTPECCAWLAGQLARDPPEASGWGELSGGNALSAPLACAESPHRRRALALVPCQVQESWSPDGCERAGLKGLTIRSVSTLTLVGTRNTGCEWLGRTGAKLRSFCAQGSLSHFRSSDPLQKPMVCRLAFLPRVHLLKGPLAECQRFLLQRPFPWGLSGHTLGKAKWHVACISPSQ